jgi:putative PIN family toxin of toxin-antitoxin system
MTRVVADTNVLVSAFLNDGKPRKLLLKLLEKHTVILSRQMLAELADVLSRDKFSVTSALVESFISILVRKATIVPVDYSLKIIMEDRDDDRVLNTALNGKTDYIVSGDKRLVSLKKFEKTEILKVNQMLEILS